MQRKISDIYDEYKIMPNLREHMYRVAGVASLICDNFDGELSKKDIITACLLHDMGNIIKFNLEYFPEYNEPKGIKYWQEVQNEYKKKYGNDEFISHAKIAREIGVSGRVVELIQAINFISIPASVPSRDFDKKIVQYSDERVGPFGVVSLEQRFLDLRKRYTHHGDDTPERRAYEIAQKEIEKQVFPKCKI